MRPRTCECGECRKCRHREYMRGWYAAHPGYASVIVKRRREREPEVMRALDAAREQAMPQRRKASRMVNVRVRKGTMQKLPCEWCGVTENVECHHRDYNKPLDVMWLCRKHHGEWHRYYTPVLPGEQQEAPPRTRPIAV